MLIADSEVLETPSDDTSPIEYNVDLTNIEELLTTSISNQEYLINQSTQSNTIQTILIGIIIGILAGSLFFKLVFRNVS